MDRFHPSRHLDRDSPTPKAALFGRKAIGLYQFPNLWTPPFLLIDVSFHRRWIETGKPERLQACEEIITEIGRQLTPVAASFRSATGILMRSSAVREGLGQRGQLESRHFEELHPDPMYKFLSDLFEADITTTGGIALIAQTAVSVDRYIHLSNERRFSKTKNEWLISQTVRNNVFVPPEGCNSIKARGLDENKGLHLTPGELNKDLRATLRAAGKWGNRHFTDRVHFEAILSESRLFLVQADTEEETGGSDPLTVSLNFTPGNPSKTKVFCLFDYRKPMRFQKLRNISDFKTDRYEPPHRLFYATADHLELALAENQDSVRKEIEEITGGRLVVREDVDLHGKKVALFNLHRTDTITSCDAIQTIKERIKFWREQPTDLKDVCIILHGFIPSRSSAWAMYSASDKRIRIHALWGLPDGLQYLTPDEYELDLSTRSWAERIHFKEFFLREQEDGSWKIEPVLLSKARSKVLSRSQARQIGQFTEDIGKHLASDVHIMFFCGIPKEAGVGDVLPWYRAREFSTYEAKREKKLQRIIVRKPSDIDHIDPTKPVAISLMPDIENYRNNEFVNAVATFAVKHQIPVEIQGSPLAHAYYILRNAGCTVFLSYAPAYERIRSKREFGKLVRDKVVQKIGGGGEKSLSFHLPPEDRAPAFFGKLVEEGLEVLRAQSNDARIMEFADLYEVVRGWIESSEFELGEVEALADLKRQKAGGFAVGEVLVETGSKLSALGSSRGPGLTLERITAPRQHGSSVEIPAGRLGLMARGDPSVVEVSSMGLFLSLRMNEEGDLLIKATRSPEESIAGQFDLDLWPAG